MNEKNNDEMIEDILSEDTEKKTPIEEIENTVPASDKDVSENNQPNLIDEHKQKVECLREVETILDKYGFKLEVVHTIQIIKKKK